MDTSKDRFSNAVSVCEGGHTKHMCTHTCTMCKHVSKHIQKSPKESTLNFDQRFPLRVEMKQGKE